MAEPLQELPRSKDSDRRSAPITTVPSPEGFGLSAIAEGYWRRIAPQLVEAKILTDLHLETFAALCRLYGEYVALSNWLEEDPERYYFTTETGYQQASPQLQQRDKTLAQLQKLWPKFGLNPESLARMRKHGGLEVPGSRNMTDFARRKHEGRPKGPSRNWIRSA